MKIVEFRYWPRWLSMRELGMTSRPNWFQRIIVRLHTVLKGSDSVAASPNTTQRDKSIWTEQTRPSDTIDVSKVRWYGEIEARLPDELKELHRSVVASLKADQSKHTTCMGPDFRQHPWPPTLTNETRVSVDLAHDEQLDLENMRYKHDQRKRQWGMSHKHLTEAVLEPIAEHTRPVTVTIENSTAIDVRTPDGGAVHLFIDPFDTGRILAYAGRKAPPTNEGETWIKPPERGCL